MINCPGSMTDERRAYYNSTHGMPSHIGYFAWRHIHFSLYLPLQFMSLTDAFIPKLYFFLFFLTSTEFMITMTQQLSIMYNLKMKKCACCTNCQSIFVLWQRTRLLTVSLPVLLSYINSAPLWSFYCIFQSFWFLYNRISWFLVSWVWTSPSVKLKNSHRGIRYVK